MDMIGQGQVIDLFSKACFNEKLTSEELSSGNPARRNLIPLLDDSYKQDSELAHQIVKPTPSHPVSNDTNGQPSTTSPSKMHLGLLHLPPHLVHRSKATCGKTITLPSGYISTDNALSAFIWQSATRTLA
jgi:hypothetical protein